MYGILELLDLGNVLAEYEIHWSQARIWRYFIDLNIIKQTTDPWLLYNNRRTTYLDSPGSIASIYNIIEESSIRIPHRMPYWYLNAERKRILPLQSGKLILFQSNLISSLVTLNTRPTIEYSPSMLCRSRLHCHSWHYRSHSYWKAVNHGLNVAILDKRNLLCLVLNYIICKLQVKTSYTATNIHYYLLINFTTAINSVVLGTGPE